MMSSLSAVGSYAATYSGLDEDAISNQPEQQNSEKRNAVLVEEIMAPQTVEISQEARAKLQAYRAEIPTDASTSSQLRTAAGTAVVEPDAISEEEETGRMEAITANVNKFIAEYLRESKQTWDNLSVVTKQIDQTYSAFLEQLVEDNPDLEDVSFGFSVNKEGTLFVTRTDGLSKEQIDLVNQALNDDDELVALANEVADAQIAVYNAEHGFNMQKTFDRDNYGQTIDMGIDLLTRKLARDAPRDQSAGDIHQRNWNSNWYNQL